MVAAIMSRGATDSWTILYAIVAVLGPLTLVAVIAILLGAS